MSHSKRVQEARRRRNKTTDSFQTEHKPILLETERITNEVTIGFTAFRRPKCALRLVKSIRQYYPNVHIIIADNGDRPADISDDHLTYIQLPFDCGVSVARNAICDRLQTPYLLLADDDFIFTEETRIGDFLSVIDTDSTIGVVGGTILDQTSDGLVPVTWAMDCHVDGKKIICHHSMNPTQQTSAGVNYYLADTVLNFALFRREMLDFHRWDDRLKVQEHWDYYMTVRSVARWRVACADNVRCIHKRETPPHYQTHRSRAEFGKMALDKWGIDDIVWPPYTEHPPRDIGRPCIVVLGVGHSGTSIVTKVLHTLGWGRGDSDTEYSESVSVREINDQIIHGSPIEIRALQEAVFRLPKPWALKDPRFVQTLDYWTPVLDQYKPALIWLTRDPDNVKFSYEKRGERFRGENYENEYRDCQQHFMKWPWAKIRLDFEAVLRAVALVDPDRV